MDDLEDVMNNQWRLISEGKKSSTENHAEGEVSLAAFNGYCNNCGKFGHKAAQCRRGNNQNQNNNSYRNNRNGNQQRKGSMAAATYAENLDTRRKTAGKLKQMHPRDLPDGSQSQNMELVQ